MLSYSLMLWPVLNTQVTPITELSKHCYLMDLDNGHLHALLTIVLTDIASIYSSWCREHYDSLQLAVKSDLLTRKDPSLQVEACSSFLTTHKTYDSTSQLEDIWDQDSKIFSNRRGRKFSMKETAYFQNILWVLGKFYCQNWLFSNCPFFWMFLWQR